MDKETAIRLLGGDAKTVAKHIGISPQAVYKWPNPLTRAIADRVEAALARIEKAHGATA
jgi:DNA-binding transcriptional regulator YdaS (Cro superfamily)